MEVMCPTQREGNKSSSLQNRGLQIYEICGKSALQIRTQCLPPPFNHREHAFCLCLQRLTFRFAAFGLVVLPVSPGALRSLRSMCTLKAPATHLSVICGPSFLSPPLPRRGREVQKQESKQRRGPSGASGLRLSALWLEQRRDQENLRKGPSASYHSESPLNLSPSL